MELYTQQTLLPDEPGSTACQSQYTLLADITKREELQTKATDWCSVVIDNGADTLKCGFSGEDTARAEVPAIVARARHIGVIYPPPPDRWIGENAVHELRRGCGRHLLEKYPFERGIVRDWDHLEMLWGYCYREQLKVDPEDYPLLITESTPSPNPIREKMVMSAFETFRVPSFYPAIAANLALYSTGRISGVVVDSGHSITQVVPIHQGLVIQPAVKHIEFSGSLVIEKLQQSLGEQKRSLIFEAMANNSFRAREVANNIKRACYVPRKMKNDGELNASNAEKTYRLPDGNWLDLGDELLRCPEMIFRPGSLGLDSPGLPTIVHSSVMGTGSETQRSLFENVILAGGNTLFPGFANRLREELVELSPNANIGVAAAADRRYATWKGGSMLASLSTFQKMVILLEEYNEFGPSVIYRNRF